MRDSAAILHAHQQQCFARRKLDCTGIKDSVRCVRPVRHGQYRIGGVSLEQVRTVPILGRGTSHDRRCRFRGPCQYRGSACRLMCWGKGLVGDELDLHRATAVWAAAGSVRCSRNVGRSTAGNAVDAELAACGAPLRSTFLGCRFVLDGLCHAGRRRVRLRMFQSAISRSVCLTIAAGA